MRALHTDAAGSLFGFLAATFVFAVSFAAVIHVSVQTGEESETNEYDHRASEASSLADLVLTNPGRGWFGGDDSCLDSQTNQAAFDPESLTRFGLGEERCALDGAARESVAFLSFDKLRNVRRAEYESDPLNAAVDYKEALASLQLDRANLNFHIRSWPLLPDIEAMLGQGFKDPNLKPLYVGDYERLNDGGGQQTYLVQHVAGASYTADAATLYVDITNNGTSTTAFSVTFSVNTQKTITVEKHTAPVAAGGNVNVTFVVNKTSGWEWKQGSQKFDYVVRDPSQTVGAGTVAMQAMSHASVRTLYEGEATKLQYVRSGGVATAEVRYDFVDGRGNHVDVTGASLEIRDGTDTVVATASNLDKKGGTRSFTLNAPGTYVSNLLAPTGWIAQRDRINVVDAAIGPFAPDGGAGEWQSDPPVAVEAAYVEAIVEQFDLGVVEAQYADDDVGFVEGGDVYPDDNGLLADRLPAVLEDSEGNPTFENYNMLFMGTDVDHRTLTSAAIKYTLRDWVLAGGTLVVFGSANQAVQWLEPIFHVALQSAGNGVTTPDQSHPVLHTPNELDYASFDNHGTAWHFNHEDDKSYFSHVVVSGEDDVLSVSNPGAFGDGRVILTSWQPYDLTTADAGSECDPATLDATCAGLQAIGNFVTIGYSDLYLDYGPSVPLTSPHGSQSRIAFVDHPEMDRRVEVYVVVYVFN